MRNWLIAATLLGVVGASGQAQIVSSLSAPGTPDLSAYATKADVAAAKPDLTAYATTTALASVAATANSAVQPAALNAAAAQNLAIMAATTPQFVGGSSAYVTLATLLATYPCAANTNGMLAHVSDAWGSVATTLVCENNSTSYYWRPQRTDFAAPITQTSGTVTLTPLLNAPIIYLTATPTSSVTVNLSTVNVWPGAQFHIYAPATIALNGINIGGLVGGGTVPLVQGSDKIVTYVAGVGWKAN